MNLHTTHKNVFHGLDFSDVLIYPSPGEFIKNIQSRSEIKLEREFVFEKTARTWLPIFASNMDTVGTFETAEVLNQYNIPTFLHKFLTIKELTRGFKSPLVNLENVFFTVGITDEDIDRCLELQKLLESHPDSSRVNLCIDVANAKSEYFLARAKSIRALFPKALLCVGNVGDGESAKRLYDELSAEIVKIGIGSGACCRTRTKTGMGIPQFSAISWVANHLKLAVPHVPHKPRIVSDGGIVYPGDVAKAFAAGADMVMIGSLFAGYHENRVLNKNHETCVRGMASREVFEDRVSNGQPLPNYKAWEGIEAVLERHGDSLHDIVREICGGLRSACTYTNCESLEEFSRKDHQFIYCHNQFNQSLSPH